MAGVVLETLSNRKLLMLSTFLVLLLTVCFLIGGLIAPAPNSVINSIAVKCYDKNETWQLGQMEPMVPRGSEKRKCKSVEDFHDDIIHREHISSNMIVFSQMFPLPRTVDLDMSRWFQNLIAVIQIDVAYSDEHRYAEKHPKMELEASLYYRDKEDGENGWKLLASSTEHRTLDCTIEDSERQQGYLYQCDIIPFFELGSVHYDYYLVNVRLPVRLNSDVNKLGQVEDIHIVTIHQNGGFTKVWLSMKTVLFPSVLLILIWFWRRIMMEGRNTNLMERTLFSLGIVLTVMNCPIEWFTLLVDMPFMMLLNDIRDGAFYAMLLSFWLIFVGEHTMDHMDRNKLSTYWKEMAIVIAACVALFIFDMCERGTQLTNPFYSIWSSEAGSAAGFGFIIVAAVAACLYFIFLCYLIFKVFRNISSKRSTLISMSSRRRQYYSGIIYRFKFLMVVTLLCAAMTVIFFIIGQLSEGQWQWGDEGINLEHTSAFLTGVYGMWNIYVIAMLCLYAPSHKKYADETGTIGLSLSSCSIPGCGPMFELQSDEMELGLGVHGEAGVKRIKINSACGAVQTMMEHMTNPKTSTNLPLKSGDRVAVLINNLGGTSVLELNIVAREAIYYLEGQGVRVERAYCGPFLTSLEMAGVSISVLHITDNILAYLDFPTEAPGWQPPYLPPGHDTRNTPSKVKVVTGDNVITDSTAQKLSADQSQLVYAAIKKVCDSLVSMEQHLNDLDKQSGDGDCGSTIARGATAIKTALGSTSNPNLPISCPHALALRIAQEVEDSMGGSSGALYSLFFMGVANELKVVSPKSLSIAWKAGLDALMKYGGARPGQRTMIDPLNAAWLCFDKECQSKSIKEAISMAAEVADRMSIETSKMDAQAGRASYVNKELLTKPDPGAVAVAVWIKAIAEAI